ARERLTVVLTLQDHVAEQGLRVEEALDRIETAREEFRAELLVAEAEPLWRDLRRHDLGTHGGAVLESIRMDLRNLRGFAASNGPRLLLDLVIFILLLNAAFALRRRVAQWTEDDPQLGRAAVMLGRPVSLALLVSLLVFPSLHAFSPSVTDDIVSVLLLVPLLRVLPPLFERTFRPLLYVVGGLFLISRARDLIDAAPVGEQLLYAAQLVVSIAIVAWLMRPARLRALPADVRLPAALRLAMRASLLLLVSALLANLLGYRSLSGVLGDGVLTSIYLALLAYGLVRATDVILRVAFHSRRARQLGVVRRRGQTLLRWTVRLTATGVGLAWVLTSLDAFAIREPVIAGIYAMLTASLSVGELSVSLGDVLAFVLTIVAAFAVSNVIRFFLDEDVFPRMRLRRGVPNAISTLLHYVFLLLGFALALSAAGMDFSRVTLLAGAFGVGIGFGLQNVVNNFVSGLILLFERPIQLGDTVEVGGLLGEVRRIGARSSTVRTVDGAEVIVPNGKLISDQVINWTLSDRRRRIDVTVGVRYGTDPTRVQGILLQVAAANESVIRDPAPQALFVGFGDSSLDFLLRCWVPRFEEGYQLRSELSVAIYAALTEADIQIPFPQRDLHLKSVDGEAGRALSGGAVDDSDR
ncbi:MAG: mechanosensitive ion channel, partial [Proteobacteria bacterium]|nr:mechanosensitive ion channel [Pseudomonadota bacterium]